MTDVSLQIDPGELIFLSGRSGAGKSTLLKLIALIERPTLGQVFVDGRNIGRLPDRQIPRHRRQIGMVFQDHKLLEDRSIFENVALPMIKKQGMILRVIVQPPNPCRTVVTY